MEVKLKGRTIPRNTNGDPKFDTIAAEDGPWSVTYRTPDERMAFGETPTKPEVPGVLDTFEPHEVVELVNRALYQIEYQMTAHKKYGKERRAKEKALREELKKQGLDPKKAQVDRELKGE